MASKHIKSAALKQANELAKCYAGAGFAFNPSDLLKTLYKTYVEIYEDLEKED